MNKLLLSKVLGRFAGLIIFTVSIVANAANFTVTKVTDGNDGICNTDCSLREAIMEANATESDDVINFNPSLFETSKTMVLIVGDIKINNNGSLVINGPGANLLTLDGIYQSRIFTINGATVTISGFSMKNGTGIGEPRVQDGGSGIAVRAGSKATVNNVIISDNRGYFPGNGIFNSGTLVLNNSMIKNNISGNAQKGGGIYNASGSTMVMNNSGVINNSTGINDGSGIYNEDNVTATISNSVISDNYTQNSYGGGIYHTSGTLNIINSTLLNNKTYGNFGGGGGIYNISGTVIITGSTISGNLSGEGGGGVNNMSGGTLTVTDSTIDNNEAKGGNGGGGISNRGILKIINSTISNNSAIPRDTNFDAGKGGGIFNSGVADINSSTISANKATYNQGGGISNEGTVNLRATIVGDNSTLDNIAPDIKGTINSLGYNLIENTDRTAISGALTGNILGRDPQLLPLDNYGGATRTISLMSTSPAIDAADPNDFQASDQRGISRPQDGDLNGSNLPDIGALEKQTTAFKVTKIADTNDGICDSDCSLREAIANATNATDNTIVFDDSLFALPRTISLTGGELKVNNNSVLAIVGKGAGLLTLSGGGETRILLIGAGAKVGIDGVNFIGGKTTTNGGGISNKGKLVLANSLIRGNTAADYGGGIFNDDGGELDLEYLMVDGNKANIGGGLFVSGNSNMTVASSTISVNTAVSNYGGGISTNGTVNLNKSTVSGNNGNGIYNGFITTINDSTISGNVSSGNGGGIYNDVILNINNSTIAANRAVNQGGGVFRNAGTVNARSSIFADNTAQTGLDFAGTLVSGGYNLIERTSGTTINGSFDGNITNRDPRLAPLHYYGGVTKTHALRPGSAAIDKGFTFNKTTDQRGQPRPLDYPTIPNPLYGNGSDIGAFERQATDSTFTAQFDFDGDGKSDISVFRPDNGIWYLQQSSDGFTGAQFGASSDKLVPADYDGDGKTDIAVYRKGNWYLNRSQTGFASIAFGDENDIPQPADYDGDGKADLAVWRPSNGVWYVYNLATNQFTSTQFGASNDKPVAADYNGDGKTDYAVFRPSNGTWYIARATGIASQNFDSIQFGEAADKPVPADYDGDGKTAIAVYRPSNGVWYLNRSQAGFTGTQFGVATDLPVPADYDGDGKTDIAVYRAGTWYVQQSKSGFTGIQFGANTDKPVPNVFIP